MRRSIPLTLAFAAYASAGANDCTCGYTVNRTDSSDYAIFTDILETDFLHTYDFSLESAQDIGWIPQSYNQSGPGDPFGMAKMAENVAANPLESNWDWGGEGVKGGDPGLQLLVKSQTLEGDGEGYVPTAEVVSVRDDILYGSFRIAMKTTTTNGTCAAFFYYESDTQEIDIEILSAQQHHDTSQWPVNLVVQNTSALAASGAASSNYEYHMTDAPDGGVGAQYREYRFDWLPGRIDYYVDSYHTKTFRDNVPSEPGAIHLSHWSNGNPLWSQGPPTADAVMTVAYVKAYFNTTGPSTASSHDWKSPQYETDNSSLCQIPDQTTSPWPGGPDGNETGWTFFFSGEANGTEGNTASPDPHEAGAGSMSQALKGALLTIIVVIMGPFLLSAATYVG